MTKKKIKVEEETDFVITDSSPDVKSVFGEGTVHGEGTIYG